MDGLALQIDGKWAVLDEDTSVSIESNSPVWGDGNSFSFAFSIDVEANRHIIGNSDQLTGQSVYEVLDGKRAVLYTLGIPVYYGKIQLEDEVEIDEGHVDITLVSGNLTFDEMIDGMNCQDVELMDRIVIGERVSEFEIHATDGGNNTGTISSYFPTSFMWILEDGVLKTNVVNPYPTAKYCNIRIAYQVPEANADGEDYDGALTDTQRGLIDKIYNPEMYGKYVVLDELRSLSAPCFYVLYFLDCLFHKLGYDFSNEGIAGLEDMCRLAFCSTRCAYDEEDSGKVVDCSGVLKNWKWGWNLKEKTLDYTWKIPLKYCVANSKNFPDIEVSELIEGLETGFGIRFLFDENSHSARCLYIRDVLRDQTCHSIGAVEIHEAVKVEQHIDGFKLTYSGDDSDTAYNYTEWGKNAVQTDSYNYIVGSVAAYNKNLYIDTRNGNAYRVKIDEEATNTTEANPALFEVGAYNPVEFGDCSNEDTTETVEINFTPVTMNDVYYKKRRSVAVSGRRTGSTADEDATNNDQMFALLLNGISLKYPSWMPAIKLSWTVGRYQTEIFYTYFEDQRFDESRTDQSKKAYKEAKGKREQRVGTYIRADEFENNSPIMEYDTGFMLGIMRGPGNEAGIEDFDENYDGENNFRYVTTATNPSFHSDTVDNYARAWDYNGTEEGGVETEGSISLKLRAEKPNPNAAEGESPFYPITESYAQKRGLFDKFYTEYAYFVVNRKIVKMTCRMEMADILNIDWTKRYKIGDYVGFINKYSYTIDSSGMSDVTLEMYYL